MTLSRSQRIDYATARIRDAAFDAVRVLWKRRQKEGMSQADLAERMQKSPAWLSRTLRGPGNWTMKTLAAFVDALDGEAEIAIHGLEEPWPERTNFQAYDVFPRPVRETSSNSAVTVVRIRGGAAAPVSLSKTPAENSFVLRPKTAGVLENA